MANAPSPTSLERFRPNTKRVGASPQYTAVRLMQLEGDSAPSVPVPFRGDIGHIVGSTPLALRVCFQRSRGARLGSAFYRRCAVPRPG